MVDQKIQITVNELVAKMNWERETAYSLIRFMENTGQAKKVGVQPSASGKGKGSNVYELPTKFTIDLS